MPKFNKFSGPQVPIGTAEITATFLGQTSAGQMSTVVGGYMTANNWVVNYITGTTALDNYVVTLHIGINLYSTFDIGTIEQMFRDDMRNSGFGSAVGAVNVTITSRANVNTNNNPVIVPAQTGNNSNTNAVTPNQIQALLNNQPKAKGTFQKIADDLQVPIIALGILGIAVLVIVTRK